MTHIYESYLSLFSAPMASVAQEITQNTPKSAPKKTKPKSEKKEKLKILIILELLNVLFLGFVFCNFETASKHEQAPAKEPSSIFRRGNV